MTNTLNLQMAVRFFNDSLARGDWSALESAPHVPSTGDFGYNTGLVALSTANPAITGTNFQWFEPGIMAWKTSGSNSRVLLRVITAMSYT